MPAKTSAEMKKALRLVEKGYGKTEAARIAGVHRSSIYSAIKAMEKAKSEDVK